jgi:uncharacterized membrane-anchored protein
MYSIGESNGLTKFGLTKSHQEETDKIEVYLRDNLKDNEHKNWIITTTMACVRQGYRDTQKLTKLTEKPHHHNDDLYNGDFKKYYDTTQKRNIWVLGYFGGGSVNIMDAYRVACDYSNTINVPIGAVKIDEVLSSRRFKGFKFIYAITEQTPEPGAEVMENVHAWLRD